jgi:ubiquinone/menaquinone biosynthesis C-methylase UbiE
MTTHANYSAPAAGLDVITDRVRATWTTGDFGRIATAYERGAAEFITRLDLSVGEKVLDVACGTGNLALPAARLGAAVTGIDIAANLIEQLRSQAAQQRLSIDLDEGNCEAMPYEDESFETVVTMFGAMFAARPDRAAAELVRVCQPGGRIIMANWTPSGFIGDMFRITSRHVPPPQGAVSPLLWGDESTVRSRLGDATTLRFTRRLMCFEFPFAPDAVVDHFRSYYGPTQRAFDALDPIRAAELRHELVELWRSQNHATDGTTRVYSEYLEVTAVRPRA